MDAVQIGGIVCLAYMAVTLWISLAKPKSLWGNPKIQGFVKLLGETGATVFVTGWGLLVGAAGVYLLVAFRQ